MKRILLSAMVLVLLVCASAVAVEYPEGTLYRGIYGYTEEIEFLQYQLFYAGYLGDDIDEVDGIFGQRTEEAVKQFQQDHGIDVTGIVCPNTVTMLDKMWEDSMEPQGGEEGYEEPVLYCYTEHYANGTQGEVLCSRHMDVYVRAAEVLNAAGENDAQTMEALQSGITIWLEEIDSSYQKWMQLRSEYAEQIRMHQEAFMDYYRAQLAVWHAHFGSPSMAALEKAQEMLADHCTELCIILSGAI